MATDTIVRVDPKTLLVGPNVRKEVDLSKEFVASIKTNGVLTPITAYEGPDGLVVVDGQRRTLAAVDAALEVVPVFITATPVDADLIVSQIVVNEQRDGISKADGVAAVRELALFDLKAPAIAKRTGLPAKFVDQAVKVGASKAAQALYEKHGDLDIASSVAEFEGRPEQAQLLKLTQPWQIREKAREIHVADQKKVIAEKITASGVTLAKEPDYYSIDPSPVRFLYRDVKLQEPLDGLTLEQLREVAGDSLVAWPSQRGADFEIAYGIRGWQKLGLHTESYRLRQSGSAKPSTPEGIEAAKVARREARESTKTWVAATAVRIEWLQQLVQRKTMPKGWEPLAAARMLSSAGGFSTSQLKMILLILQLEQSKDSYSLRDAIVKHLAAVPTRAPQIMLAIDLGCVEGGGDFDKKGWNGEAWQMDGKVAAAYLTRLEGWGYTLSEFEQGVAAAAAKGKKVA